MRAILGTALGTAAAAVIGSVASRSSVDTWYRTLDKPPYVPPNVVFPIAWTSLYAGIAVTSGRALDTLRDNSRSDARSDEARSYATALGANLVLNAGWSWLFFKYHELGASAVAAAALAASSADLARRTAKIDPAAGAALVPYPLWCTFATVMSTDIWRRNRR